MYVNFDTLENLTIMQGLEPNTINELAQGAVEMFSFP